MMAINKNSCRKRFNKAAASYDEFANVQNQVLDMMLEQLPLFKIKPQRILDLGSGTGNGARKLAKYFRGAKVIQLDFAENMLKHSRKNASFLTHNQYYLCADAEWLPLAESSMDMIFSSLSIQWCENILDLFQALRRCLRPNGLFLFSSLGANSLIELRQAWLSIDKQEHVNSFHSIPSLGDQLIQAGFHQPVLDREIIKTHYKDNEALMKALKGLGVTNNLQGQRKSLTGKQRFRAFLDQLNKRKEHNQLPLSYEVIFGHAWAVNTMKKQISNEYHFPIEKLSQKELKS